MKAQAYGHHLLIKLPTKKTVTDGGLALPENFGQKFVYGRVISLGQDVRPLVEQRDATGDVTAMCYIEPGSLVIFDHLGARELTLDPTKDEGVVCIHDSMIFAVIHEPLLTERKLPIP